MNESITEISPESLVPFSKEAFERFASPSEDTTQVLTLTMPTETKGAETRKNAIVFKNLLSDANGCLDQFEGNTDVLRSQLSQFSSLEDQTAEFWQHQGKGLVVVITDQGETTFLKTPFSVSESVEIGDRASLGHLYPFLGRDHYYFLLLELGSVRLFESGRWEASEIELKDVPTSLDEAMKFDDPEESIQYHAGGAATGGGSSVPMYHGQGVTGDETKQIKVQRFFEMLDKGLADNFPDREVPLILFGKASEVGHFKDVCSYPHLEEEPIDFSPADLSDEEIAEKLKERVAEESDQESQESVQRLEAALGNGSGTADFEAIVAGSQNAQIDTLWIGEGAAERGHFDPDTQKVTLSEDGIDLIDFAVTSSALTGAEVRVVSDSHLPDETSAAAILRFP